MPTATLGRKRETGGIAVIERHDVAADAKKRISLRNAKTKYFHVKALSNGCYLLEPRVLVLPQAVVKRLGLPPGNPILVRYADGRRAQRAGAEGVYVEVLGRHGTFTAVVEPRRKTALLGAIVLEDLDLVVDCTAQRLVPRDPRSLTSEIE